MDDTENYLNSILKKRLGSVVNYNGSSKTAVTRISKQQQKVQHMPTVFRKKHQSQQYTTGYMFKQQQQQQRGSRQFNNSNNNSNGLYHSQQQLAQSQYLSNHGDTNKKQQPLPPQQRVQYMLISKRIQSLKEQQYDQSYQFKIRTKTVDVTNYNNKQSVNNNDSYNNSKNTIIKRNFNRQLPQHQSRQSPLLSMEQEYNQNYSNSYTNNNNDLTSNYCQQKYNTNTNYNDNSNDNNTATNLSKRKRIFNKNNVH